MCIKMASNAYKTLKGSVVLCILTRGQKLSVQTKTIKIYKTGVINDPLGQPTVPACSDWRLILKFWDVRTVRTDALSV